MISITLAILQCRSLRSLGIIPHIYLNGARQGTSPFRRTPDASAEVENMHVALGGGSTSRCEHNEGAQPAVELESLAGSMV